MIELGGNRSSTSSVVGPPGGDATGWRRMSSGGGRDVRLRELRAEIDLVRERIREARRELVLTARDP